MKSKIKTVLTASFLILFAGWVALCTRERLQATQPVTLAWDREPGCTYVVHFRRQGGLWLPHKANAGYQNRCTIKMAPGAYYRYYVTAHSAGHTSKPSDVITIRLPPYPETIKGFHLEK